MSSRTPLVLGATALLTLGALGVVTAAVATPGSGTTVVSGSASGRLDGSEGRKHLKVKQDGVELRSHGPTDVTTFDLEYPPGSYSGWHSHPGIVIAVVTSGQVVRQSGCTSQTFRAGQAFTEVGAHQVSNPSEDETAVLSITRIYPSEDAATARIDEPAPAC